VSPIRINIVSRFVPTNFRKSQEERECLQCQAILQKINAVIESLKAQKGLFRNPFKIELLRSKEEKKRGE
jgi:hypothetical protein